MAGGRGTLSWTPHKLSYEVKGYLLYRKEGAAWEPLDCLYTGTRTLIGTSASLIRDGTYMLTSLEWSGLESDTSSPTITIPSGTKGPAVTKWDKTPPPAVAGFTVAMEAQGQYRLKWEKNPAGDLRYYNLYFSDKGKPAVSQKRLISSPQETVTEYLDWTAPTDAAQVFYAITAVDRQGNESEPAFAELKR